MVKRSRASGAGAFHRWSCETRGKANSPKHFANLSSPKRRVIRIISVFWANIFHCRKYFLTRYLNIITLILMKEMIRHKLSSHPIGETASGKPPQRAEDYPQPCDNRNAACAPRPCPEPVERVGAAEIENLRHLGRTLLRTRPLTRGHNLRLPRPRQKQRWLRSIFGDMGRGGEVKDISLKNRSV